VSGGGIRDVARIRSAKAVVSSIYHGRHPHRVLAACEHHYNSHRPHRALDRDRRNSFDRGSVWRGWVL
jgi:hypothetical protein